MTVDGVDLPAVDEVRILRLRAGDTVVAYVENNLDDDKFAILTARLRDVFPDNKVLVMEGVRLEVLRRDDDEVT